MGEFKLLRGYSQRVIEPQIPEPQINNNLVTHGNFVRYEPMRQNRFLIIFPENTGIPSYLVKSSCRPSCRITNSQVIWNDMEITFHDPIDPSTQRIFVDMITNRTITNIMDIKLHMLDPIGNVVSEWIIYGHISEVNFGEVDYSSHNSMEVSINLVVRNAILNY